MHRHAPVAGENRAPDKHSIRAEMFSVAKGRRVDQTPLERQGHPAGGSVRNMELSVASGLREALE